MPHSTVRGIKSRGELLAKSRAKKRADGEFQGERISIYERMQSDRDCTGSWAISRVIRDSASTIPGKAPIRTQKPKSGSREEIITGARHVPKRPRSYVECSRALSMPEDHFRLTKNSEQLFLPRVLSQTTRSVGYISCVYREKLRLRHCAGKWDMQNTELYRECNELSCKPYMQVLCPVFNIFRFMKKMR